LAKFLRKCALEALDISDIGLGPTGCSIELEEAMISNKTILQFDIRYDPPLNYRLVEIQKIIID
jgi:hypothetical protein